MTGSQLMASSAGISPLRSAIAAECHRIEEDALYSAKGNFEAARVWGRVHLALGIPTSVLAAVASVAAFNDQTVAAGVVAILVAALSSVSTFLNPSGKAQAHHLAGTRFNGVRSQSRILREVTSLTSRDDEALAADLQKLVEARDALNQESPIIPRPAFEKARKGIEAGEASYAIDRTK